MYIVHRDLLHCEGARVSIAQTRSQATSADVLVSRSLRVAGTMKNLAVSLSILSLWSLTSAAQSGEQELFVPPDVKPGRVCDWAHIQVRTLVLGGAEDILAGTPSAFQETIKQGGHHSKRQCARGLASRDLDMSGVSNIRTIVTDAGFEVPPIVRKREDSSSVIQPGNNFPTRISNRHR